jgi:hypothetical protein
VKLEQPVPSQAVWRTKQPQTIQGDRGDPQSPRPGSHKADSRLEVVDDRGEMGESSGTASCGDDFAARRLGACTLSDLVVVWCRGLPEQGDQHDSGAREALAPSLSRPQRDAMPTVLEHDADQRPAAPQMSREKVRKDPPGCAALVLAVAAEHEHLGPAWPTHFAREDALAAVVHVHDADLAGKTATQLEEGGVGQRRLMLLERGHIASEDRSTLLFARAGSIEVCATNDLRVGGRGAVHTTCCLPALFISRKRRDWAPPRPLWYGFSPLFDGGRHRDSVSRSRRRPLARQPPTPGLCVRRAASNCPDQTGTSHQGHEKNALFATADRVADAIVLRLDGPGGEAFVPRYWAPIVGVVRTLPETIFQRLRFLSGR